MGFFDFLKRKQANQGNDEGPSPEYIFAHYALRQIALSDPLQFLALIASPDAERFMETVLEDVAQNCDRKASFDAASINIHTLRIQVFPCAIIELPEPKEIAEAYMVALVLPLDVSTEAPPESDSVVGRFFTLEKGLTLSNEPRTVLAEWTTSSHANFGDGPAPNVEAFASALSEHL